MERPPDSQGSTRDSRPVTPERFGQIRAVFEAAMDLPAGERHDYVTRACAGDDELLQSEALDYDPVVSLDGRWPVSLARLRFRNRRVQPGGVR